MHRSLVRLATSAQAREPLLAPPALLATAAALLLRLPVLVRLAPTAWVSQRHALLARRATGARLRVESQNFVRSAPSQQPGPPSALCARPGRRAQTWPAAASPPARLESTASLTEARLCATLAQLATLAPPAARCQSLARREPQPPRGLGPAPQRWPRAATTPETPTTPRLAPLGPGPTASLVPTSHPLGATPALLATSARAQVRPP